MDKTTGRGKRLASLPRATGIPVAGDGHRTLPTPSMHAYKQLFPRATSGAPAFDTLIVGAGFAGAVTAERLASQAGQRVLVVTHGGTLWMFRMLLERWTWDEAAERFRSGTIPQCSATAYAYSAEAGRLVPQQLTHVYWRDDR